MSIKTAEQPPIARRRISIALSILLGAGLAAVEEMTDAFAFDTVTVAPVASSNPSPVAGASSTPLDPDKVGFDAICEPVLKRAAGTDAINKALGDQLAKIDQNLIQQCTDKQAMDPNWKMDATCKRALTDQILKDPATSQQLLAFCQERKAAQNGLSTNESLSKTWLAVGATCMAVCSQPWGQQLCPIGAGYAAINELMKGAQIQQLFMSLMGGQMAGGMIGSRLASGSMVESTTVEKVPLAPQKTMVQDQGKLKTQQKQKSCYSTAIFALLQGFLKQQGSGAMKSTISNAEDQIRNLYGQGTGPTIDPVTPKLPGMNNAPIVNIGSGTGTNGGAPGIGSGGGDASMAKTGGDPCGSTSSKDAGAMISCAVSKDAGIPAIARDPRFADAFQAKTGTSLGDFMKNSDGMTASDIGQAFGGGDAGRVAAIESSLKGAAAEAGGGDSGMQNLGDAGKGAGYAQGRGGAPSRGGSESGPDFAKLMEGALGGFGRKPASGDDASSKDLDFSTQMQNKSAEQIAQDTKISIFDRVSYRYKVTSSRLTSP